MLNGFQFQGELEAQILLSELVNDSNFSSRMRSTRDLGNHSAAVLDESLLQADFSLVSGRENSMLESYLSNPGSSEQGSNDFTFDSEQYEQLLTASFTDSVHPRIVINDAIGPSGSRAYAAEFNAVVQIGGCSGTLIDADTVLTARHCGINPGDQARFGPDSLNPVFVATVESSFNPAGGSFFSPLLDGGDVAITTLSAPVPESVAIPMRLTTDTEIVGRIAAIVGYGLNGVGSQGHQFTSDGQRWGGENIIDQFGVAPGTFGSTSNIISTDFDNDSGTGNTIGGSNPVPLEFEATTAGGDSGGPILVRQNGEWVIAGVLSGGTNFDSSYGDISWWTGIGIYAEEIIEAGGEFVDALPDIDDHADNFPGPEATFLEFSPFGQAQRFFARDFGFIGYEDTPIERDVFGFVIGEDTRVIVDAKARTSSLDAKLELYDAAGNLVATNDNSENPATANPQDSQLSVNDLPAGDYYVAVSGAAETTGGYRLAVRLNEAPVGNDDVGNSIVTASIVDIDAEPGASFARATIDYGNDRDFYQFIANQTGELIIRSKALGDDNDLNTVLRAYDSNRQQIANNNNFRGKLDSRIVLSVEEGQQYSVQLSSVGNTTGNYRVSLRFQEPGVAGGGGFTEFARNQNESIPSVDPREIAQFTSPSSPHYENGLLA